MGFLLNDYCHADIADAADYALAVGMYPNGFLPDSYTTDALNFQVTLNDTVAPTDSITLQTPSCPTLGHRPWIVAPMSDIALLWGAAATVIFAAWGFKMAKLALKG